MVIERMMIHEVNVQRGRVKPREPELSVLCVRRPFRVFKVPDGPGSVITTLLPRLPTSGTAENVDRAA